MNRVDPDGQQDEGSGDGGNGGDGGNSGGNGNNGGNNEGNNDGGGGNNSTDNLTPETPTAKQDQTKTSLGDQPENQGQILEFDPETGVHGEVSLPEVEVVADKDTTGTNGSKISDNNEREKYSNKNKFDSSNYKKFSEEFTLLPKDRLSPPSDRQWLGPTGVAKLDLNFEYMPIPDKSGKITGYEWRLSVEAEIQVDVPQGESVSRFISGDVTLINEQGEKVTKKLTEKKFPNGVIGKVEGKFIGEAQFNLSSQNPEKLIFKSCSILGFPDGGHEPGVRFYKEININHKLR